MLSTEAMLFGAGFSGLVALGHMAEALWDWWTDRLLAPARPALPALVPPGVALLHAVAARPDIDDELVGAFDAAVRDAGGRLRDGEVMISLDSAQLAALVLVAVTDPRITLVRMNLQDPAGRALAATVAQMRQAVSEAADKSRAK